MLAVTFNCECRAGICCIVPPPGWAPPFALEKGTNGMSAESFRFLIRRQLTSHLCMRLPNTSRRRKAAASGRSGSSVLWTHAVWLLYLMQTCLQSCCQAQHLLNFGGKCALRAGVVMQAHCAIKHVNVVDPAIGKETMLMHDACLHNINFGMPPGNAPLGMTARCHSHITSGIHQF